MMSKKFNTISDWFEDTFRRLKSSYSDDFYYDDFGIIRQYEKQHSSYKVIEQNLNEQRKNVEKIYELNMEIEPKQFTLIFKEMLSLENKVLDTQKMMNRTNKTHHLEQINNMKNIVALSKLVNVLIAELPKESRIKKKMERIEKFQLRFEPTLDILKEALDEKLMDSDKENESRK